MLKITTVYGVARAKESRSTFSTSTELSPYAFENRDISSSTKHSSSQGIFSISTSWLSLASVKALEQTLEQVLEQAHPRARLRKSLELDVLGGRSFPQHLRPHRMAPLASSHQRYATRYTRWYSAWAIQH